ncbi:hypothetical protein ACA910_005429 [Epithemia clementina (nom. ined.)]
MGAVTASSSSSLSFITVHQQEQQQRQRQPGDLSSIIPWRCAQSSTTSTKGSRMHVGQLPYGSSSSTLLWNHQVQSLENECDVKEEQRTMSTTTLSTKRIGTRRQWFVQTGATVAATATAAGRWGTGSGGAAYAAVDVAVEAAPTAAAAVCDPSVSVWKLPGAQPRMLYLLGTAHISEQSAQLAEHLVYQVHPNAVFVELDLRRIVGDQDRQKINPNMISVETVGTNPSTTTTTKDGTTTTTPNRMYLTPKPPSSTTTPSSAAEGVPEASSFSSSSTTSRIVIPRFEIPSKMLAKTESTLPLSPFASSSSSSPSQSNNAIPITPSSETILSSPAPSQPQSQQPSQPTPRGGGGGGGWLQNWGAALVGKAIRGMYQQLGQAGFQPGQEFAVAMQAAQSLGADIILGDQDVKVTLQRLSAALAVTDFDKLMAADSEMQTSMQELLLGPGAAGSSSSTSTTTKDDKDDEDTSKNNNNKKSKEQTRQQQKETMKQELTAYVENMKSRDKLRVVLAQLQEAAPALVQVMLTERNAYMAAAMNDLGEYPVLTAVVGIAHQDGIEQNLQAVGWQPVAKRTVAVCV